MNRKKAFRFFGFLYLFFGAIFLLNGFSSITGFVIVNQINSGSSSIFGIVFFIIGILLTMNSLTLEKIVREKSQDSFEKDYFKKRVEEIFDSKYDGQDVWISRWELAGIIEYIKNTEKYHELDLEHGSESVSLHTYATEPSRGKNKEFFEKNKGKELPRGLPTNIPHLHVYFKEGEINHHRHLFVTDNPTDPRIKTVGIVSEGEKGKRVPSRHYDPNHPSQGKRVNEEIQISYSRLNGELGSLYQNIIKSEKLIEKSIAKKNKEDFRENMNNYRENMNNYISKLEETKIIDDNHKLYSQEIKYIRKDFADRLRKYRGEFRNS